MSERRGAPRTSARPACKAKIERDGQVCEATVVDLSWKGTGLVTYRRLPGSGPRVGDKVALEIETPLGLSRCGGKVVWVDAVTGGRRFGIAWAELPADAEDPLRRYLTLQDAEQSDPGAG